MTIFSPIKNDKQEDIFDDYIVFFYRTSLYSVTRAGLISPANIIVLPYCYFPDLQSYMVPHSCIISCKNDCSEFTYYLWKTVFMDGFGNEEPDYHIPMVDILEIRIVSRSFSVIFYVQI